MSGSRPATEAEVWENAPEVFRRAAWQSAVIRWLFLHVSRDQLADIIWGYIERDPRAIAVFELADKRRRQENSRANRTPDTWKRLK